MRKWIGIVLCLLLLAAQVAAAEDARPGQFVSDAQEAAYTKALQAKTTTTFTWGGLPLLDQPLDDAIESLLSAIQLESVAWSSLEDGFVSFDVLLQKVSVLDFAMLAQDGVYYEQSNLLDGQTVAFTPQEFANFAARISARSGGLLPPDLDSVFSIVMHALGGGQIVLDGDTIDGALTTLEEWRQEAFDSQEVLRPVVSIPGLYGARAETVLISREEILALVALYSDLLADNDALWAQAAVAQNDTTDPQALNETAQYIAEMVRQLPQILEDALAEEWPGVEWITVLDANNSIVVHQLEIPLLSGSGLYLEWVPSETISPVFAVFSVGESRLEFLLTHEPGDMQTISRITRVRNRTIAELHYSEPDLAFDLIMTRNEQIESRSEKETVTTKTDWMMESGALLGEGAVVTLSVNTVDTAAGQGADYTRRTDTEVYLKGLGFDKNPVLSIASRTKMEAMQTPIDTQAELVRPARMDDETLGQWLADRQVSLLQVGYTILGRLPADVAGYLLTLEQ